MRRQFQLPAEDEAFLDSLDLEWETVIEKNVRRVVIYGCPVPPGYNVTTADRQFRIEGGYPDTEINMAYFYPPLARVDGKSIGGLVPDHFDGKVWQRWSRHRTSKNPWRLGIDGIATHFSLATEWLELEFKKR